MNTSEAPGISTAQDQRDETKLETAIWKAAALLELLASAVCTLRQESGRTGKHEESSLAGYDALSLSLRDELLDAYYEGRDS